MAALVVLAAGFLLARRFQTDGEDFMTDPGRSGSSSASSSREGTQRDRVGIDGTGKHKGDTPEKRAKKHKDLTEWEHVEVKQGIATLRLVNSTAPKGLYFEEQALPLEEEEKRLEERKQLRQTLGLDMEPEGEFVLV